ncbi:MAG: nucleotidyltransferase domain-containing protein [Oscillospiraceae bacterium]|nr:nucleotidyltransferase domain-containing protein [Oscillospiraceae bacterium]
MVEAISKMTNEIVRITGGSVYGIWLYGSVVMDDFRMGWSDIDFIALTDGRISEDRAEKLLTLRQEMLEKEPGNPYYRSFEGIIADGNEYRSRAYSRLVYWGTSGQRITDRYVQDVFSEFELAKYGKPVYGNKPWEFPAPDRDKLVKAIRTHYDAIRKYAVKTDGSLYSCGWLLDIARCVYTLRYNDVIAKTQAGLWALEEHIFPDEAQLRKAVELRRQPLSFKDREDVKQWLESLGPTVQSYADVLERELHACAALE